MEPTFLFYDLETTGTDPAKDSIMQFAAQRTDVNLYPIGEAVNLHIRLEDDKLPSPGAALITGLTPQKVQNGISELELVRYIHRELFTPNTIVVGFNNISFDDNFIRYACWRNFYEPYEWAWKDGRSRWDLLPVSRMVRAIRPDGIKWPVDEDGKICHKLEKITEANGLIHHQAHDGLSDVIALIELAQLIRARQPKMFEYLLAMRDKRKVSQLIGLENGQPFVHTATRFGHEYHYTSVAVSLTDGPTSNGLITYNLRHDPTPWLDLSASEIAKFRFISYEELASQGLTPFPFHSLAANTCPAVAPLSVLEGNEGWSRLGLSPELIQKHLRILQQHPSFIDEVKMAYQSEAFPAADRDAEERLYDGFLNEADKRTVASIRTADVGRLATWAPFFHDERLPELFLRYKARNFREILSPHELEVWQAYLVRKFQSREPQFLAEMAAVAELVDPEQQAILQELTAWHQSLSSRMA